MYPELKDIKIVCCNNNYKHLKEYLDGNFPGVEVILWREEYQDPFEENQHYLCVRHVPRFSQKSVPGPPGSWRYFPLIRREDRADYGIPLEATTGKANLIPYTPYAVPLFPRNCKVSFLNTEHCTDKYLLEYIRRYIPDTMEIYDYSLANLKILGRGKYLPYPITQSETLTLKSYLSVKVYDVCMVGTFSLRRQNIFFKLLDAGIKTLFIGYRGKYYFGKERDTHIGSAKILLNVHNFPSWRIYESIRCERWRAAGMPIISERSETPVPHGVIECEYNDIVETVKNELKKL